MNTRLWSAVLLLLLSTCQKDDEFNASVIPGEYTGTLNYFTSVQGGGVGDNVPDLSKSAGYKTVLTKVGSNYTLSFDKSFKYTIPDISLEFTSFFNYNTVMIRPVQGQDYSLSAIQFHGTPANYISVDEGFRIVTCKLELKSNAPDSIYFLHLYLSRFYWGWNGVRLTTIPGPHFVLRTF